MSDTVHSCFNTIRYWWCMSLSRLISCGSVWYLHAAWIHVTDNVYCIHKNYIDTVLPVVDVATVTWVDGLILHTVGLYSKCFSVHWASSAANAYTCAINNWQLVCRIVETPGVLVSSTYPATGSIKECLCSILICVSVMQKFTTFTTVLYFHTCWTMQSECLVMPKTKELLFGVPCTEFGRIYQGHHADNSSDISEFHRQFPQ